MGGREILKYLPDGRDADLFARANKEVIYQRELVKHGYKIDEKNMPEGAQKA